MNASEAREMYRASLRHPNLVTQVVPSPITFEFDSTIQDIVKEGILGEILYIEVSHAAAEHSMQAGRACIQEPHHVRTMIRCPLRLARVIRMGRKAATIVTSAKRAAAHLSALGGSQLWHCLTGLGVVAPPGASSVKQLC